MCAEERELQFKTAFPGPIALFQDRYMNMPFQSWSLRPRGANHCVLTLIASINEVSIEIKVCFIYLCKFIENIFLNLIKSFLNSQQHFWNFEGAPLRNFKTSLKTSVDSSPCLTQNVLSIHLNQFVFQFCFLCHHRTASVVSVSRKQISSCLHFWTNGWLHLNLSRQLLFFIVE